MVGCGDKLISSASKVEPFGLYKLYTLDPLDGYVVLRLVDPVDPTQCSVRWCRLHRFFPRLLRSVKYLSVPNANVKIQMLRTCYTFSWDWSMDRNETPGLGRLPRSPH